MGETARAALTGGAGTAATDAAGGSTAGGGGVMAQCKNLGVSADTAVPGSDARTTVAAMSVAAGDSVYPTGADGRAAAGVAGTASVGVTAVTAGPSAAGRPAGEGAPPWGLALWISEFPALPAWELVPLAIPPLPPVE